MQTVSIRATPEEHASDFVGDEIAVTAKLVTTHAITIDTTAANVWPWVAQIGQGRGGFYSYTMLENLLGCRMVNADRIHPEWQQLSVGDCVSLHPKASPLIVALIEPSRHLVLRSNAGFAWTWAFLIRATGNGSCRLLVRTRVAWSNPLLGIALRPVMGPGHFIMERRMLYGIKSRAEKEPGSE